MMVSHFWLNSPFKRATPEPKKTRIFSQKERQIASSNSQHSSYVTKCGCESISVSITTKARKAAEHIRLPCGASVESGSARFRSAGPFNRHDYILLQQSGKNITRCWSVNPEHLTSSQRNPMCVCVQSFSANRVCRQLQLSILIHNYRHFPFFLIWINRLFCATVPLRLSVHWCNSSLYHVLKSIKRNKLLNIVLSWILSIMFIKVYCHNNVKSSFLWSYSFRSE